MAITKEHEKYTNVKIKERQNNRLEYLISPVIYDVK